VPRKRTPCTGLIAESTAETIELRLVQKILDRAMSSLKDAWAKIEKKSK
jgi:flagellar motor switch protein FliM